MLVFPPGRTYISCASHAVQERARSKSQFSKNEDRVSLPSDVALEAKQWTPSWAFNRYFPTCVLELS